jgi:CysZ protein
MLDRGFNKGIGGFVTGAASVVWGLGRLMRDAKLRGLAVLPLGLAILIYVAIATGTVFLTPWLLGGLKPDDGWVWVWWFGVIVATLGLLVVAALLFTAIVELVGGPFYDKMATHLLDEQGIAWKDTTFLAGAIPDLVRALVLAVPALVCWALSFIPFVGFFFVAIGVLLVWFGLGAAAINPALQMTGHAPPQRNRWLLKYLWTTLGVGAVVAGSLFIPLFGMVSIPSAVIGATQLYIKTGDREPL